MWMLRLLAVLTGISVAGGVAAYFLTRNPGYLRFSLKLFTFAVVVALLIFALLIIERIAVIPV